MTGDLEERTKRLRAWAIRLVLEEEFGHAMMDENEIAKAVGDMTLDQAYEHILREHRQKHDRWSARLGRILTSVWRWRPT